MLVACLAALVFHAGGVNFSFWIDILVVESERVSFRLSSELQAQLFVCGRTTVTKSSQPMKPATKQNRHTHLLTHCVECL